MTPTAVHSCYNKCWYLQFRLVDVWLFATLWTAAHQASCSITDSWSLLKLNVHQVSDAIQPSHSLRSPSPPTFNLSQNQGLFQWVRSSCQVAKILEFQLQISPSNEYSGLISLTMHWLDLFAIQETLKHLLQHHSSKASIHWLSLYSNSHIHTLLLEKT